MTQTTNDAIISGVLADWAAEVAADDIPATVGETLKRVVLDASGLMVAARRTGYVQACVASAETIGGKQTATAIGHAGRFTAGDAALISGTAAHGEDFDDTFEGTPVHVGAVLVPALLAAGETEQLSGPDLLRGLAIGGEIACRMAVVAPTAIHRAAFHPTAVIGAMSAAAGVASAMRLDPKDFQSALGIVGSMASGIIEYLAEGTSTKRLHPGWAAQCGIRAARLARAGFDGPRTVFEGEHGFFKAFADPSIPRDFSRMTNALGGDWLVEGLAFKPYACGTMVQPFIDCAIELRRAGLVADEIAAITARVGEGTVHRLWEPLSEKRTPTTPYSAKFSGPFGIAIGLVEGAGGLEQFTEERVRNPNVLAVSGKVDFEIDPENPYPANYTGELVVTLKDGTTRHVRQPHLRGGRREPLTSDEIVTKYQANAAFGGWDATRAEQFRQFADGLFEAEKSGWPQGLLRLTCGNAAQSEAVYAIRRQIDVRRCAVDEVRDDAARGRRHAKTVVRVAERDKKIVVTGHLADRRQAVRERGAAPHPRLAIIDIDVREQRLGVALEDLGAGVVRRGINAGELGRAGTAHAGRH